MATPVPLAFSSNNEQLAIGFTGGTVQLRDRRTNKLLASAAHGGFGTRTRVLAGQQILASAGYNQSVKFWDVCQREERHAADAARAQFLYRLRPFDSIRTNRGGYGIRSAARHRQQCRWPKDLQCRNRRGDRDAAPAAPPDLFDGIFTDGKFALAAGQEGILVWRSAHRSEVMVVAGRRVSRRSTMRLFTGQCQSRVGRFGRRAAAFQSQRRRFAAPIGRAACGIRPPKNPLT